jgi:hypothetical protein
MSVIAARRNHTHPTAEQPSIHLSEVLQSHTIQHTQMRSRAVSQGYELLQQKAVSCPSLIEAAMQQMLERQ